MSSETETGTRASVRWRSSERFIPGLVKPGVAFEERVERVIRRSRNAIQFLEMTERSSQWLQKFMIYGE